MKVRCAVPRGQECINGKPIAHLVVERESSEETGNARMVALEQLLHGCAIVACNSFE